MAWSNDDHKKATDPNRSTPLSKHEIDMLEQGAKQAGSWGDSARSALERDKNR